MKDQLDLSNIPQHIAVIMDGNGRWAKQKGAATRIFGHQHAVEAVRAVIEGAAELEVKYLTLYAFSTENWNRPEIEVTALMQLLVSTIRKETKTLVKNNIKLRVIGDFRSLPSGCQKELTEALDATKNNTGTQLLIALSYSGRWDILQAVNKLVEDARANRVNGEVSKEMFEQCLATSSIPDPELLIRTSGELRISNFLLWQLAYSELYFTDVLWPDFRKNHLWEAILAYQQRERRFGKTSDQVKPL